MCGFAGFSPTHDFGINAKQVGACMAELLAHRGGDDFGVKLVDNICLAHSRLAIVDLSSAGHQPMTSTCGDFTISFNGEIYNHLKIREILNLSGLLHTWNSESDTETLLVALKHWGVRKTLQKVRGMFAFAFYDKKTKLLTLARDRIGEKPLYWGWINNTLFFASELKAMKAHPAFDAKVNRNAVALLTNYSYIPAPYSIYEGIEKLRAGHFVQIRPCDNRSDVVSKPYWTLEKTVLSAIKNPIFDTDKNVVEILEKELNRSITRQMLGDVPIGTFLSGGIDSSLITAMMQRIYSSKVQSFTIGFENPDYDEAEQARQTAEYLGTNHTELYVKPHDFIDVIDKLPEVYSEPFADSSQIPMVILSGLTRKYVKVVLSGDGGDELFGGYNYYKFAPKVWKNMSYFPLPLREIVSKILINFDLPVAAEKIGKVLPAKSMEELHFLLQSHWINGSEIVRGAETEKIFDSSVISNHVAIDFQQSMMFTDTLRYMADDILVKVDRAAMYHGLETRVPLLDPDLLSLSWRIPLNMKIRNGTGKWILRELLARYLPHYNYNNQKKGFSVPLGSWLRGPLRDWAESLLDEKRLSREGYFHAGPIRQAWTSHLSGKRDHSRKLWNILMFQGWLERQ